MNGTTVIRMELSSMTNRDSFGDLPAGYEAGYVDSLSNRSHSRSNGHDLNVGFNYSDDTWMFNASLGSLRRSVLLIGKSENFMRTPQCVRLIISL